jgi:uncharacterized membrane protein YvbJ
MASIALFLAVAMLVFVWSVPQVGAASEELFSSPEDAMKALVKAVRAKDKSALEKNFSRVTRCRTPRNLKRLRNTWLKKPVSLKIVIQR